MDYEFWFWMLVAFILGRVSDSTRPLFYIGPDEKKYMAARFAVLVGKKK